MFKIRDVLEKGVADKLIEEKLHILNFLKGKPVILELNESISDEDFRRVDFLETIKV